MNGMNKMNKMNGMNRKEDRMEKNKGLYGMERNEFMNKFMNKRILLFSFALLVLLCAFSVHGKASGLKEQEYKYYTSITVEYGDTLWSIAGQYMDQDHYSRSSYIAEVKNINHIKNEDMIKEGKMLIIPYFSKEYIED